MGLRGMPSCDLIFEDVRIPKRNVVLQAGEFRKLMTTFDIERCGNAAMCLGIAGGAFEEARTYATERKAFGRPICEFQDVQFTIVNMAMQLDAARLLVYRAATGAGQGFPVDLRIGAWPSASQTRWQSTSPARPCKYSAATDTARSSRSSGCTATRLPGGSPAEPCRCCASPWQV